MPSHLQQNSSRDECVLLFLILVNITPNRSRRVATGVERCAVQQLLADSLHGKMCQTYSIIWTFVIISSLYFFIIKKVPS